MSDFLQRISIQTEVSPVVPVAFLPFHFAIGRYGRASRQVPSAAVVKNVGSQQAGDWIPYDRGGGRHRELLRWSISPFSPSYLVQMLLMLLIFLMLLMLLVELMSL